MWSLWEVIPILIDGAAIVGILQFVYPGRTEIRKLLLGAIALYVISEICFMITNTDIEVVAWSTMLLIVIISLISRKGSFSSRLLAAVITILIIFTLRYCIRYGCAIIFNQRWIGKSYHYVILSLNRLGSLFYYIITGVCESLVCWLLYKKRNEEISFSGREEYILSIIISIVVALATRLFFGLYRSFSLELLEICLITAILFLLIFAFASLILTRTMIKQKTTQNNHEKISLENQLLSSSYEHIVLKNEELLKQRHNFIKHLNVIRNLQLNEVYNYVDNLLKSTKEPILKSHTGDPYVDAVLNSKIDEMKEKNIDFRYSVGLPKPINISSSDICSILYNLIENAIEACEKIEDENKRVVELSINHKGQFITFVCRNSILPHSVSFEDLNHSTKKSYGHGFGIMSIKECAARNGGSVSYSFEEDFLTCKVMLQTD